MVVCAPYELHSPVSNVISPADILWFSCLFWCVKQCVLHNCLLPTIRNVPHTVHDLYNEVCKKSLTSNLTLKLRYMLLHWAALPLLFLLQALVLVNNLISKAHPRTFLPLICMQRLYLSHNLLTTVPKKLPYSLLEFRINDNWIKKVTSGTFSGLGSMSCIGEIFVSELLAINFMNIQISRFMKLI